MEAALAALVEAASADKYYICVDKIGGVGFRASRNLHDKDKDAAAVGDATVVKGTIVKALQIKTGDEGATSGFPATRIWIQVDTKNSERLKKIHTLGSAENEKMRAGTAAPLPLYGRVVRVAKHLMESCHEKWLPVQIGESDEVSFRQAEPKEVVMAMVKEDLTGERLARLKAYF